MVLPLTGGSHEGSWVYRRQDVYKNRRQNTSAQYIATRPLLDLREGAMQRGGARVKMRWWDQKGIDWDKAKARGAETESESKSETDMEGEATREAESRASGLSRAEWRGASADEWEVMQTS